MSPASLDASRSLWRAREEYRHGRWRRYVASKPVGHPLRAKWYALYEQAVYERRRRDVQIKRLGVTGVSVAGVELVKRFEGFRSAPYRDAVGVWTIGYGETRGVSGGSHHVTEPEAASMLRRRLDRDYFPAVRALPTFRSLTQNQVDALTSFAYNVGPGGLDAGTKVGAALRRGDWRSAGDHLMDWNRGGGRVLEGLTNRRRAERDLFDN